MDRLIETMIIPYKYRGINRELKEIRWVTVSRERWKIHLLWTRNKRENDKSNHSVKYRGKSFSLVSIK